MDKLTEIFNDLEKCKPYKMKTAKTKINFLSNLFLAVAAIFLVFWILGSVFFLAIGLDSKGFELVAYILFFLAVFFAALSLLIDLIGMTFDIFAWVKRKKQGMDFADTAGRALVVIKHDEKNTHILMLYEVADLQTVSAWLQKLIKRRENRLVYFFGNQVALYSLIVAFIYFWDRFGGVDAILATFSAGL